MRGKGKEVSREDAEQMKVETNSLTYLECSVLSKEGVKAVFDAAVRVCVIAGKQQKETRTKEGGSRKCVMF